MPLSVEKTEGLSFLGIEFDTVNMVFRLPQDKLSKFVDLVRVFCSVKRVTLRQMQSLLGLLVFACRIMHMDRVFSRRLSLATRGASHREHHIRITKHLKDDLWVWLEFLNSYNGRTCYQSPEISSDDVPLFTDAAGSVGFGAVFGTERCTECWPDTWRCSSLCQNLTLL